MSAIVTDIEGTTTPIDFVQSRLFPYARARLGAYLRAGGAPEVVDDVRARLGGEADLERVVATLERWSDEDLKLTPLKALQGMVWAEGYRDGSLRAPVYPDVPRALERWRAAGRRLAVYSSGSVAAQRLLFGHTDHGDLSGHFEAWFDTTTGAKREVESYRRITTTLGLAAGEVTFLSDVVAELDAAREAGLHTFLLTRDGPVAETGDHRVVPDFDAIG